MADVTSGDSDLLAAFSFKAEAVEYISQNSALKWISPEEFIFFNDQYCLVYRLAPFHVAGGAVDKFPVSVTRMEFEKDSQRTVLHRVLQMLKDTVVDVFYAQTFGEITNRSATMDIAADQLFLTDTRNSGVGTVESATEKLISNVVVEPWTLGRFQLAAIHTTDGDVLCGMKQSDKWGPFTSTAEKLCDFVSADKTLKKRLSGVDDLSTLIGVSTFTTLCSLRQLGYFVSTKHFLFTNLRPDNKSAERFAFSIQRSGHIIFWKFDENIRPLTLEVVGVCDDMVGSTVASAAIIDVDLKRNIIVAGSTDGVISMLRVSLGQCGKLALQKYSDEKLNDGNSIPPSMIRFLSRDENKALLFIGRSSFLFVYVLDMSDADEVTITASAMQKLPSRFNCMDVTPFKDMYVVSTSERLTMFEIVNTSDGGIKIQLSPDEFVKFDDERIFGFDISHNSAIGISLTSGRFVDKYLSRKPTVLQSRCLVTISDIWNRLLETSSFADKGDLLTVLRALILHQDKSIFISEKLVAELQSQDALDCDAKQVSRLKLLRFATFIFANDKSKKEDYDFWSGWHEKVTRILGTILAKGVLERISKLKSSKSKNPLIRQIKHCASSFFGADSVNVSENGSKNEISDYPLCPICNCTFTNCASVIEHICERDHHLPFCALTFLPITTFSYGKCNRCDLAFSNRSLLSDVQNLFHSLELCPFCDGSITC